MKKFVVFTFLLIVINLAKGQPCYDFHRIYLVNKSVGCGIKDIAGFKLFGQSKSAIIEARKVTKYQVVFFGGYDYKIGVCTQHGYLPIHLRLINPDDQSVIYDNASDEYAETLGFTNEKTKTVIIEVTLLAENLKMKDIHDSRACIGVAIYWMKTPRLGLEN